MFMHPFLYLKKNLLVVEITSLLHVILSFGKQFHNAVVWILYSSLPKFSILGILAIVLQSSFGMAAP